MKRLTALVATVLVGLAFLAVPLLRAGGAGVDTPLSVTPYGGFASSLTRAPYVTDLTQTSAYVNWATTSITPGSVAVVPASGGVCPSALGWSPSAIGVTSSLPGPVNPLSPTGTMTGWQFTVTGSPAATSEYQASVPVTGLLAATQYCYTVFSTDNANAVDLLPPGNQVQSFTTLEPVTSTSATPVSFDVIDDTGENYQYTAATAATDIPYPNQVNPDQAALYKEIGSSGADFLLSAGDIAYSGATQSTFGDLEHTGTQPEVSNFFGPSYYPLSGGIPIFAGSGDHGQNINPLKVFPTPETATTSGGVYAYDSYSGNVDSITGNAPDDWYAFSTGNVRIYVLDGAWADGVSGRMGTATGAACVALSTASAANSCAAYQADADEHWQTNSPEYKWLAADLAAYPGGVKMAVFHFPLRSVNASQPSDPYLQNSSANPNASTSLEALLAANGVQIAFNGHAHTYQRIIPNNYQQNGQIVNYVTGGGGGVLEPIETTSCANMVTTASVYALGWNPNGGSGSACGGASVPTAAADVYNFLKVTVAGQTVTVTPTNAAGGTFDPQSYTYPAVVQPSSPSGVSATLTSETTAEVTWSPATEAGGSITSYQISRNGSPLTTVSGTTTSFADSGLAPGTTYVYRVTAIGTVGQPSWPGTSNPITTTAPAAPSAPVAPSGPTTPQTDCVRHLAPGSVVGAAVLANGLGYYEVDAKGDVAAFGGATCYGGLSGLALNKPIVGMAYDTTTGGYWLVASDGGVFAFRAPFYGSTGALHLNKPIVGMAFDPATGGYWLVASDGGIFSGHAPFHGSTGAIRLNKPIVGMAVDVTTGGYWLVASDGGVFSFDAPFHGSTGDILLNAPIVGIIPSKGGKGYRLVASDGGVFTGHATFWGSAGNLPLVRPVIGGLNDDATDGYWLVASDGGVFSYHAPFFGSGA